MVGYMDTRQEGLKAEPTLHDVIEMLQHGFERVERKLEAHDARFDALEERLQGVERRLFKVEVRLEDVADAVHGHEKRLITLERWKKNIGKAGLAGA